jgi:hypothetical protein
MAFRRSFDSNGITAWFQSLVVATICVRLRGTFTRGRRRSRNTNNGKSKIYGTRDLKRLHFGTKR